MPLIFRRSVSTKWLGSLEDKTFLGSEGMKNQFPSNLCRHWKCKVHALVSIFSHFKAVFCVNSPLKHTARARHKSELVYFVRLTVWTRQLMIGSHANANLSQFSATHLHKRLVFTSSLTDAVTFGKTRFFVCMWRPTTRHLLLFVRRDIMQTTHKLPQ